MGHAITFVLEPFAAAGGLEHLWRSLDRTGQHSFFVTWPWIEATLRCGGSDCVLVKAVRDGEFRGLALLGTRRSWLRHLIPIRQYVMNVGGNLDSLMIEQNGFAVVSGDGAELNEPFVQWFEDRGLPGDELVMPGVNCEIARPRDLLTIERRRPGFRTPLSGLGKDGFLGLLSRNARHQLRRSVRDYGGRLSLDRAQTCEQALDYFEQLKFLHVKSWTRRNRPHAFQAPAFEKFHRCVIGTGVAEGCVDLLRVTSDDRVLGFLYNFVRNGIVSSYQSGFADDVPGLRPGYVCHAMAISHYVERGMRYYDFLAGSNRLKESFGVETYELCWRQYRRRTLPFLADSAISRAIVMLRSA
jgi:CelD/BcsL family acetyltransferase involved in cellulose biosynthesis